MVWLLDYDIVQSSIDMIESFHYISSVLQAQNRKNTRITKIEHKYKVVEPFKTP